MSTFDHAVCLLSSRKTGSAWHLEHGSEGVELEDEEEMGNAYETAKYVRVSSQKGGRWQVRVRAGGKDIYLGRFGNAEEGARIYDSACYYLKGSQAKLNFPNEQLWPLSDEFKAKLCDYITDRNHLDVEEEGEEEGEEEEEEEDEFSRKYMYAGVCFVKKRSKWQVKVGAGGRQIYLLGDQAKLNFPDEQLQPLSRELKAKLVSFRQTLEHQEEDEEEEEEEEEDAGSATYVGVIFRMKTGKWQVQVRAGGKQIYLGTLSSEEEGARLHDRACYYLKGVQAKLYHPDEQPRPLSNEHKAKIDAIAPAAAVAATATVGGHKRARCLGLDERVKRVRRRTEGDKDAEEKGQVIPLSLVQTLSHAANIPLIPPSKPPPRIASAAAAATPSLPPLSGLGLGMTADDIVRRFPAYQVAERLLGAEQRASDADFREIQGKQREHELTKKLFEMVAALKKYEE